MSLMIDVANLKGYVTDAEKAHRELFLAKKILSELKAKLNFAPADSSNELAYEAQAQIVKEAELSHYQRLAVVQASLRSAIVAAGVRGMPPEVMKRFAEWKE